MVDLRRDAIDWAEATHPTASRQTHTMDRLLRATINTWRGLLAATRSEEAFRQELIALVLAVPLAFFVAEAAWTRLALIGVVLLILIVEMLNTAIEKLADRLTTAHDPQIGRVGRGRPYASDRGADLAVGAGRASRLHLSLAPAAIAARSRAAYI